MESCVKSSYLIANTILTRPFATPKNDEVKMKRELINPPLEKAERLWERYLCHCDVLLVNKRFHYFPGSLPPRRCQSWIFLRPQPLEPLCPGCGTPDQMARGSTCRGFWSSLKNCNPVGAWLSGHVWAPMCEPGRYQVEGSRGSQQIWGFFFLLISMFVKHETIFGLCLGLLDLVNVFLLFLVSS